jgi:hypothetical protein
MDEKVKKQISALENKEIQVPCPQCSNATAVKLIQVAREANIECPVCHKQFKLKDKNGNVKNSLEAIEKLSSSAKNIKINVNVNVKQP